MWSVNKLYNYYEQKISIIIDVPYSSWYIGWLKDNGETPSPAAIQEYMNDLFIGNGVIPKPSITPCLVEKGVEIIYGQYEIATYMHGMTTFTIPFSKIEKYLTPEARRLAGLGD